MMYLGVLSTSKPLVVAPEDASITRFQEKLERELKAGVVGILLLLVIERRGPEYGYRLLRIVEEESGGRFVLKEGTAYPLLQNLEKSGFVESYWSQGDAGPPRKYYQVTPLGRAALTHALVEWRSLARGMDAFVASLGG